MTHRMDIWWGKISQVPPSSQKTPGKAGLKPRQHQVLPKMWSLYTFLRDRGITSRPSEPTGYLVIRDMSKGTLWSQQSLWTAKIITVIRIFRYFHLQSPFKPSANRSPELLVKEDNNYNSADTQGWQRFLGGLRMPFQSHPGHVAAISHFHCPVPWSHVVCPIIPRKSAGANILLFSDLPHPPSQ